MHCVYDVFPSGYADLEPGYVVTKINDITIKMRPYGLYLAD